MKRSARLLPAAFLLLAGLAAVAPGCTPEAGTALIVEVFSDLTVGTDIDAVQLVVERGGAQKLSKNMALGPGGARLPIRVALLPQGPLTASVEVKAIGVLGTTQVVTDAAIVMFVAGQARTLKLFLGRSCIGRTCPGTEICWAGDGTCRSKIRSDLPTFTPGPPVPPKLDGGAGGSDAAADGVPSDASADGRDGTLAEAGDAPGLEAAGDARPEPAGDAPASDTAADAPDVAADMQPDGPPDSQSNDGPPADMPPDMATPDGPAPDAPPPDMPPPDLPPDGPVCIPTSEDCFNGRDEDCDNLVDCADLDCNPTAECIPVVGGNNIRGAAGMNVSGSGSACPIIAPTGTQLGGGLSATGCTGCNCNASSAVCDTGIFYYIDAAQCSGDTGNTGGTAWGTFSSNQPCLSNPIYSGNIYGLRTTAFSVRTPCSAGGTASKGTPIWTQQTSFCAVTQLGGGCASDSVCKPRFTGGELACVLIPGDTTCPTGMNKVSPSTSEMPWHTGFTDNRTCSACGCTTNCSPLSIRVGSDWLCIATGNVVPGGQRRCFAGVYSPPIEFIGAPSCSASSTVAGSVSLNGPHTVCCRP